MIMDLLCDTNLGALKNIDTIYPKANKLFGNLVSWQITTFNHHVHNHLCQIIKP
jgi:hypothetical protein